MTAKFTPSLEQAARLAEAFRQMHTADDLPREYPIRIDDTPDPVEGPILPLAKAERGPGKNRPGMSIKSPRGRR